MKKYPRIPRSSRRFPISLIGGPLSNLVFRSSSAHCFSTLPFTIREETGYYNKQGHWQPLALRTSSFSE